MKTENYLFLAALLIGIAVVSCSSPVTTNVPAAFPPVTATRANQLIPTPVATPTHTMWPTFTPVPANTYPTASKVKANAVAFIVSGGLDLSLWVANLDGSGERKLVDLAKMDSQTNILMQWSPDGKWISYISGNELWIISPDGSDNRKVLPASGTSKKKEIWSYSWSPDSSKIAYIKLENEHLTSRILDLETGNISEPLLGNSQLSLSWSPDGRYILLNTETSLTLFEVATRKVLKEINSVFSIQEDCPIWHYEPVWSPNSKWFYHPIYATGEYSLNICVSGIDGSGKRIYTPSSSRLPTWDKTGNFLYFTTQDTKQRLLQYNVRTQETKTMLVLDASETSKWSVSISPEGHVLEIDGTVSGNQQLFIFLNLDSLSTTRFKLPEIPSDTYSFNTTFWSADNQNLVFVSAKSGHLVFYRLDSQTGKTTAFSGEHSIEHWAISPIAATP